MEHEHVDIKYVGDKMVIASKTFHRWAVKVPIIKNRRTGTVSFQTMEYRDFTESTKLGIVYIDPTRKQYTVIPRNLVEELPSEIQNYQGAKDALVVLYIKEIIEKYNLQAVKIT